MALQWKREPWRKLYVREEGSFAGLPLYARALAGLLIKLVDDHGRIALGGRAPWEAIAFRAGATRGDRRLLRGHVEQLLEDGYLVIDGDAVRIRNFVPAQLRYDRVRGEHELADERQPRPDAAAIEPRPSREPSTIEPRPSREPSTIEPRPSREPSTIEPRPSREPSTKSEPSAGDPSIHVVASRSETKRSETIRNDPTKKEVARLARQPPVAPDPDAFALADRLRAAVLATKPNHRVGDDGPWQSSTRRAWARAFAQTLRRRPRAALEAAIAFVEGGAGQPYAFVVESAKALDEKLDRIEAAMARTVAPPHARRGYFQPDGTQAYQAGDLDL